MIAAAGEGLGLLRERKRVGDLIWLATLIAVFLALAVPWFLRLLEIDFAPAAWSLFAFAAVYLGVSTLVDRFGGRRALIAAVTALDLTGVVVLGFVWHLVGGIETPLFLLVFALPVVTAGALSQRWQPFAAALLAIAVVVTVMLVESPELRWYAVQLGLPGAVLAELLPARPAGAGGPFPGLQPPPAYAFVQLQLFAALLLAVALVTASLGTLMRRFSRWLDSSALAVAEAEGLAQEVLRSAPLPAALLFADTRQVVQASDRFVQHLLLRRAELAGRDVFELIDFSYPEVIEELLAAGGEAPFAVYRVGGETRVARVRVTPVRYGDDRYRYLSLEDLTDLHFLRAALDAVDEPLLVVGGDRRLRYFNRAAADLLGDLHFGVEAETVLAPGELQPGWWEPGARRRRERGVTLGGRPLRAVSVAAPIRGEREALAVLTLREPGEEGAA